MALENLDQVLAGKPCFRDVEDAPQELVRRAAVVIVTVKVDGKGFVTGKLFFLLLQESLDLAQQFTGECLRVVYCCLRHNDVCVFTPCAIFFNVSIFETCLDIVLGI
ncbi:MAG TPA: hypothetical protein PLM53_03270 [Spirochaetota bacterium]|nr:hypothetical protein [Spirochaetota bacterium]HPC40329.1 hypothetical protein [Spirochaetota bacterium]HPL16124.1 hypothetical protein [Spirochaetota bacterium]HQF07196.1 hypothetical protein [Spirochaetota bacterium]HQH96096.1 hypothetical protein [Spirochaetota bacterium]